MRKHLNYVAMALVTCCTLACEPPSLESTQDPSTVAKALSQGQIMVIDDVEEWSVDTVTIPTDLRIEALESGLTHGLQAHILGDVFGDEELVERDTHPEYRVLESGQMRILMDPASGRVHLRSKRSLSDAGPARELDRGALQGEALSILERLGADSREFAEVEHRTLKRDVRDDDDILRTELLAHVTFVGRQIGGVPVVGSRMVVTHDREGNLMKVMGWWPRVREETSRLGLDMEEDEAQARIAEEVRFHEERLRDSAGRGNAHRVLTRPVLMPEEQPDGTVSLNLQVEMLVEPAQQSQVEDFKPLQIRVDI